ncbi:MAG TPA: cation diffusion facilitator family transporter [Syntrophorhabdaceae bacterium]|nr:cation diffusion facilitator family transporter [Syntrophorhabdaceae bacterium]
MDVKQKASLFAAVMALVLALSKFTVGLFSGSMAVVSSGLDSLLDVFMSAMNFYAIKKASEPADDEHRYGHGKAEDLAGALQSLVIVFSGSIIIFRASQVFIQKKVISYSYLDLIVMCLSLAFSFIIAAVLKRIGNRTGSNALKADALHYTSDLYSNTGAIIAIMLTYYTGITAFDLVFAVIIGLIIIFSAINIFRSSISGIMDTRLSDEIERDIREIINGMSFPSAGFHKLRTRHSGNRKYIDFHLLACRKLHVDEAHTLSHRIEGEIKKRVTLVDVIVHVEPCENECDLTEITCVLKKR